MIVDTLKTWMPSHQYSTDPQVLAQYASDRSKVVRQPSCVVWPESSEDVQRVLRAAVEARCPLICRGAGTGTTGAAVVPMEGGIVMSFERMAALIELDKVNSVAVVEPGMCTGTLKQLASEAGLFYPPDPASVDTCTLGGNVACNAGGPSGLKYGVTGDYILGLEGFYWDGEPFAFGGKLMKNVAGYDMMRLLIGSEGTLAVITKIIVKLIPKPKVEQSLLLGFDEVRAALDVLIQIRESGVIPAAAEYIDQRCVTAAFAYLEDASAYQSIWMNGQKKAYLLLNYDGMWDSQVSQEVSHMMATLHDLQGVECVAPATPDEEALLWTLRRSVSDALRHQCPDKVSHDVVVPPSEVATYMVFLEELSGTYDMPILGYGHLGDGNIHVNCLVHDVAYFEAHQQEIEERLFAHALSLGGSLSGEHGIGVTKRRYMPLMYTQATLDKMRDILMAFCPKPQ